MAGIGVTVGSGDGVGGSALMPGDGIALFDGVTVVSPPQLTDVSMTRLTATAATAACPDVWKVDERHMVTLPGIVAP
jgi:hypothetical protein